MYELALNLLALAYSVVFGVVAGSLVAWPSREQTRMTSCSSRQSSSALRHGVRPDLAPAAGPVLRQRVRRRLSVPAARAVRPDGPRAGARRAGVDAPPHPAHARRWVVERGRRTHDGLAGPLPPPHDPLRAPRGDAPCIPPPWLRPDLLEPPHAVVKPPLKSRRHHSTSRQTSERPRNQLAPRHSSRKRLWKLSTHRSQSACPAG
jgi:hypothetical protein